MDDVDGDSGCGCGSLSAMLAAGQAVTLVEGELYFVTSTRRPRHLVDTMRSSNHNDDSSSSSSDCCNNLVCYVAQRDAVYMSLACGDDDVCAAVPLTCVSRCACRVCCSAGVCSWPTVLRFVRELAQLHAQQVQQLPLSIATPPLVLVSGCAARERTQLVCLLGCYCIVARGWSSAQTRARLLDVLQPTVLDYYYSCCACCCASCGSHCHSSNNSSKKSGGCRANSGEQHYRARPCTHHSNNACCSDTPHTTAYTAAAQPPPPSDITQACRRCRVAVVRLVDVWRAVEHVVQLRWCAVAAATGVPHRMTSRQQQLPTPPQRDADDTTAPHIDDSHNGNNFIAVVPRRLYFVTAASAAAAHAGTRTRTAKTVRGDVCHVACEGVADSNGSRSSSSRRHHCMQLLLQQQQQPQPHHGTVSSPSSSSMARRVRAGVMAARQAARLQRAGVTCVLHIQQQPSSPRSRRHATHTALAQACRACGVRVLSFVYSRDEYTDGAMHDGLVQRFVHMLTSLTAADDVYSNNNNDSSSSSNACSDEQACVHTPRRAATAAPSTLVSSSSSAVRICGHRRRNAGAAAAAVVAVYMDENNDDDDGYSDDDEDVDEHTATTTTAARAAAAPLLPSSRTWSHVHMHMHILGTLLCAYLIRCHGFDAATALAWWALCAQRGRHGHSHGKAKDTHDGSVVCAAMYAQLQRVQRCVMLQKTVTPSLPSLSQLTRYLVPPPRRVQQQHNKSKANMCSDNNGGSMVRACHSAATQRPPRADAVAGGGGGAAVRALLDDSRLMWGAPV